MAFTFRPARRENTPLIIGVAGPTKSGKTYSALRLATGMKNGGRVAMINAEGARGHQYADKFDYIACDIAAPFSPERYTEALKAAADEKPAVVIIDSASHCHDGPGGMLEYHEAELDRLSKNRPNERDKFNFTAWIRPKAAENEFIYTMLSMDFPIILCFRAKEKLRIVPGKAPIDLGWQPIAGERVAFETIFTLVLPPHSKGVPDLSISDMREPFDTLIPKDMQLDEALGQKLAEWAKGGGSHQGHVLRELPDLASSPKSVPDLNTGGRASGEPTRQDAEDDRGLLKSRITGAADKLGISTKERNRLAKEHLGNGTLDTADLSAVQQLLDAVRAWRPER